MRVTLIKGTIKKQYNGCKKLKDTVYGLRCDVYPKQ